MNRPAALLVATLAFAVHAPAARACGYCIEDKIASVYDHAAITRALAKKHHVAFFALDGQTAAGASTKRALEQIAESVPGADAGSARASVENASLSVAFDPARVPYASLMRQLEKKLAPKGLAPMPLRVMDRPADLKALVRS